MKQKRTIGRAMGTAMGIAMAAAAMSGAMAIDGDNALYERRSRQLKGPNTNGKFPEGFTPQYMKKFYFDEKGNPMKEANINMAFHCTAINQASANKKFKKWNQTRIK